MEASAPAFCHQLKSLQGEPEPLIGGPSNEWSIAQKMQTAVPYYLSHWWPEMGQLEQNG